VVDGRRGHRPEQAFRDLDELLEKHPEYFDDDPDT